MEHNYLCFGVVGEMALLIINVSTDVEELEETPSSHESRPSAMSTL